MDRVLSTAGHGADGAGILPRKMGLASDRRQKYDDSDRDETCSEPGADV